MKKSSIFKEMQNKLLSRATRPFGQFGIPKLNEEEVSYIKRS